MLGNALRSANNNLPPYWYCSSSLCWDEEVSGECSFWSTQVPEECWVSETCSAEHVTIAALRFDPGNYVGLHQRISSCGALLIPGKKQKENPLLRFSFFREVSRPAQKLIATLVYEVRPKIWHGVRYAGEIGSAYLLVANPMGVAGDIKWRS